ncbi:WG repeat-containing protein [Aureispira]|nr:WG repeat-containing protein [Aureispira sp.]
MKWTQLILIILLVTNISAQSKWSCIDIKGNKIFSTEVKSVSDFSGGLAKICKYEVVNRKKVRRYGYVNTQGKIVIPCIYRTAKNFNGSVAWVKKPNSEFYTLIDKTGTELATRQYKKVGSILKENSDRIAVYDNGKMGFINDKGQEVISCKYLGAPFFKEGLCCVIPYDSKSGQYGFIDINGKVVLPFQYKQAGFSSFNDGLCRVSVDGKTVLIDKTGKVVFKTNYGSLQKFHQGRAAVATKSNRKGWGFVNEQGNLVIDGNYDHVTAFSKDGWAIVEKDRLQGLIDTDGTEILPLKYESIYADLSEDGYVGGIYPAVEGTSYANTKKDYFLKDMKPLMTKVKYLQSANNTDRILFCNPEGKIGYMDRSGTIVINAIYSKGKQFHEGSAWVKE